MPKIREKEIIRLEADEVASLLDFVEHGGDHLTGRNLLIMKRPRNVILRSLHFFLELESSVSELVGLKR